MALALDPSGGVISILSATAASFTITLNTTNAQDVVCVGVYLNSGSSTGNHHATSITSANITWQGSPRATKNNTGDRLEIWKGIAVAPLSSEVITVNLDASFDQTGGEGHAWAVSGANTASSFDANGALPALGTTSDVLINTNNPNDFCFAFYLPATASATAGAGWTQITSRIAFSEFRIVSLPQVNLDATVVGDTVTLGIGDAIVQAGAAAIVDTFGNQMNLVQMKRKISGWTPPLVDHRRRVLRPNRALWVPPKLILPKNFKKAA